MRFAVPKIYSPGVRVACWSAVLLAPGEVHSKKLLDVPYFEQELDQWCWVATTKMILEYYGDAGTGLSQCEIAEHARVRNEQTDRDFGRDDCCTNPGVNDGPDNGQCNIWNYNYSSWDGTGIPKRGCIRDLLLSLGEIETVGEKHIRTGLDKERVEESLEAHIPVHIFWQWNRGGHFLVGHGLDENTFYYLDPYFGEGAKLAEYDFVVEGTGDWDSQRRDHSWDYSLELQTPPTCVCSVEGLCCDGCRPKIGSDGEPCGAGEVCVLGVCQPDESDPDCDDLNPCTRDTVRSVGDCVHTDLPDGHACGSGESVCEAGTCVVATPPEQCPDNERGDGSPCPESDGTIDSTPRLVVGVGMSACIGMKIAPSKQGLQDSCPPWAFVLTVAILGIRRKRGSRRC